MKGARNRYVVAVTSNGTNWTHESIVEQLKQFDDLPILALEVDNTKQGLQVEVVTRFDDIKEAFKCAKEHNKSTIYDSFRDKPMVAMDIKQD